MKMKTILNLPFHRIGGGNYESPTCDIMKISSEGMLCSSFETPDDQYYKAYEW